MIIDGSLYQVTYYSSMKKIKYLKMVPKEHYSDIIDFSYYFLLCVISFKDIIKLTYKRKEVGRMLSSTVLVQGYMMESLYINRAKFAIVVVNGISMPFFKQLNSKLKQ